MHFISIICDIHHNDSNFFGKKSSLIIIIFSISYIHTYIFFFEKQLYNSAFPSFSYYDGNQG